MHSASLRRTWGKFSDCYTSQGVWLTFWLSVLALHGDLHSPVATVVEYIYNEYIHNCGMSSVKRHNVLISLQVNNRCHM